MSASFATQVPVQAKHPQVRDHYNSSEKKCYAWLNYPFSRCFSIQNEAASFYFVLLHLFNLIITLQH